VPKITAAHEQQRRAQILSAAMACFARQGYHATSMDDVVRESGLSVGAIYSYFASKEDLFLALSDDRANQTLAYLNDLFRRPGPMPEKTQAAVDYFFTILSDQLLSLARVDVEFMSEAAKSERVKAAQELRCDSVRQFLRWMLREAQREGQIRPDVDIDTAAELMLMLNEGIVLLSAVGLRKVSLEALKPAYLALLNTGLSSPSSAIFIRPSESVLSITNGTHHHMGGA
jgi:AcrR family transcriptional regulator